VKYPGQMHRAASRFTLVAREASVDGDLPHALKSLSGITQQRIVSHAPIPSMTGSALGAVAEPKT
jgi:hypothetical protein